MGAGELFVSERDPTAGGPSGRHPPGEPASQREGDGPLIALVHGSLDRSASFARLLSRLSHYRVLSYDRRG
ncbi:MAG: alpha/beta fold hydrolase, partial [Acidimicrobiales bacterium]